MEANASLALFTRGIPEQLRAAPVDALRLSLHPAVLARRIVNVGEWREHILARPRHQIERSADERLVPLYEELRGYLCADPRPEVELPGPGAVAVPLRPRVDERELALLRTTAVFGTPLDSPSPGWRSSHSSRRRRRRRVAAGDERVTAEAAPTRRERGTWHNRRSAGPMLEGGPLQRPIVCPVLVGRAAHLAALNECLARVRADGKGQIMLVQGEAGVG